MGALTFPTPVLRIEYEATFFLILYIAVLETINVAALNMFRSAFDSPFLTLPFKLLMIWYHFRQY